MSLRDEVETALLELIDPELFGSVHEIDGEQVTCIWRPEQSIVAGDFSGQVVERYRLTCDKTAFTAVVGQEVDVDGIVWTVADDRGLTLITDLILARFTA